MSAENEAVVGRFFEEFCAHWTGTGAHRGELLGDALGMLQQVGAVAAPA